MIVAAASEAEWPLACRLAVGGDPERAAAMLNFLRSGAVDPRGLWLARRGGLILGAISAQVLPGGGGVLLPPRSSDAESQSALLATAVDFLHQAGCDPVHCAIDDGDLSARTSLSAAGFARLGGVHHFACAIESTPDMTNPDCEVYSFVQYSIARREEFRSVVEASYLDSEDFPELQQSGTEHDTLSAYAEGPSEPPLWWLARDDSGASVGAVILAENGVSGSWEMSYLGVVPEARRRGVGDALVCLARRECTRRKIREITLSVDSRNSRAIRLYSRHGFRFFASEGLYLLRRHATN